MNNNNNISNNKISNNNNNLTYTAIISNSIPLICTGHERPVPHLSYSSDLIVKNKSSVDIEKKVTELNIKDTEKSEDKIDIIPFLLVSACLDGRPMLRNGQTGDWIGTFIGHKGAVWSATLNDLSTLCATSSADYTVKIWDTITGENTITFEHGKVVKTAEFSKVNSSTLATGGFEKLIRIYDIEKHDTQPTILEGHTDTIKTICWLSAFEFISGSADNTLKKWDLRVNKKEVMSITTTGAITSIEVSRNGKQITTSAGSQVTFYDTNTLVNI